MTIVERSKVLAAYARVLRDVTTDHEKACAVVAQSLGVPAELVHIVLAEKEVEVQP